VVTSIEIFRGKDYLDPKNPPKSVKRGSEQTASFYPKVFLHVHAGPSKRGASALKRGAAANSRAEAASCGQQ
jgi:hypothetical protein